jgi:hypothetical protein
MLLPTSLWHTSVLELGVIQTRQYHGGIVAVRSARSRQEHTAQRAG